MKRNFTIETDFSTIFNLCNKLCNNSPEYYAGDTLKADWVPHLNYSINAKGKKPKGVH